MGNSIQEGLAQKAREAACEGAVLLENKNSVLPFKEGSTVAVFGRIQTDYYKSGTGSGGSVNVEYVVNILDGLRQNPKVNVYEGLAKTYADWIKENPFDDGMGWAQEPWSQVEMPLSPTVVKNAKAHADAALIIIGRTAGEDKDSGNEKGSYLLSDGEEDMLRAVCAEFDRVVVFLNIGSIIDLSFMDRYPVSGLLIGWQGGQEGGAAAADLLCGDVSPSGKLPDSVVYHISDYPSDQNFGDRNENKYVEDIYVGYRYFESFRKESVRYPFGFGLSYTDFEMKTLDMTPDGDLKVSVKNTGDVPGKEVVEVYVEAPQGALGKPDLALIAFAKTRLLSPGEEETLTISYPVNRLASYDDSGKSGHESCWVMEKGEYHILVGTSVRNASSQFAFMVPETQVVKKCEEAMRPTASFYRMRPTSDGISYEPVPTRSYDLKERIQSRLPEELPPAVKSGTLREVKEGRLTLEEFVAQFTDQELCELVRGEGMCSPKATPGIASCFGGTTPSLAAYGLPVAGCSDGPSGIRMDCGTKATSLPNGTLLASTFNLPLVEELYELEGKELRKNKIDTLLGPGINIHRHPLNGRNFEYFSEDPLLTGLMAVAQLKGMHKVGVTGTIKHFCCNNQETNRHGTNSVVSERALREIYLKPFEIAVCEGGAKSIMTSYNPTNGTWTAGSYDLATTILRKDWGFSGIVMTDWWAKVSDDQGEGDEKNLSAMVRAQNDLYMVVSNASDHDDNLEESLKNGSLTRAELQRCAVNICRFLIDSLSIEAMLHPDHFPKEEGDAEFVSAYPDHPVAFTVEEDSLMYPAELPVCDKAERITFSSLPGSEHLCVTGSGKGDFMTVKINILEEGSYAITMRLSSNASHLAQMPIVMWLGSRIVTTFVINGTDGKWVDVTHRAFLGKGVAPLRLMFGSFGADLAEIQFTLEKKAKE